MASDQTDISVERILSDLEKIKDPSEKQAFLDQYLNKKEEKVPQIIGVPEHAGTGDVEPCL